jgi:hypothetical protein
MYSAIVEETNRVCLLNANLLDNQTFRVRIIQTSITMHLLDLNYDVLLRTFTFLDVTSIVRSTEVCSFHRPRHSARVPSHIKFPGLFCFPKAGAVKARLAGGSALPGSAGHAVSPAPRHSAKLFGNTAYTRSPASGVRSMDLGRNLLSSTGPPTTDPCFNFRSVNVFRMRAYSAVWRPTPPCKTWDWVRNMGHRRKSASLGS